MTYQTPPASSIPAFLLKPEKKRDYEEVQVLTDEKKSVTQEVIVLSDAPDEEQEEEGLV